MLMLFEIMDRYLKPLLALLITIILSCCLILHIIPDHIGCRLVSIITIALSSSYYICYSFYPDNQLVYTLVHFIVVIYFGLLFTINLSLTISPSFYQILRKTAMAL